MWAISHYIAIKSLNKLNIPILFFENFYKKPFEGVKILMDYLGVKKSIHPSHIYSPSMTTSKTLHGLKKNKEDLIKRGSVAFWDDIINEKLLDEIINIINEFEIDHYDSSGFPKSESIMSS